MAPLARKMASRAVRKPITDKEDKRRVAAIARLKQLGAVFNKDETRIVRVIAL